MRTFKIMEEYYKGKTEKEAFDEYYKINPLIVVDLLNPVSTEFLFKRTPYILSNFVMQTFIPEYKEIYDINKVYFQRSEWLTNLEMEICYYFQTVCYYFQTEEEKIITVYGRDFEREYANVYHYTEEYACK